MRSKKKVGDIVKLNSRGLSLIHHSFGVKARVLTGKVTKIIYDRDLERNKYLVKLNTKFHKGKCVFYSYELN